MIIQQLKDSHSSISVKRGTKLLNISRSGFYRWSSSKERINAKKAEEEKVLIEIKEITSEMAGYGYRRITKELEYRGFEINHKKY